MDSSSHILVLNGGSSSLKFALFDKDHCVGQGSITGIGNHAAFHVSGSLFEAKAFPDLGRECKTTTDATHFLLKGLEEFLPPNGLAAIGHRVVHGGDRARPERVTPQLLAALEKLVPLAPLHQPFNLEAIRLCAEHYPDVPQVACFDTSFHATMPPLHRRFALPRLWHDKGVKRYGFHGLSYEYVTGRLPNLSPRAFKGRTLIAHLGSGASLCALKQGQSFDTSMGFSALDGLVMGTRPGTLDAGVLLYFLQEAGLDEAAIEHMLYHDSGLLGVSGISSDMQELLSHKEPAAREALDLFCLRITREAGGLISLMGGLDVFVFTGGIGEHAVEIRAQVSASLGWAGLVLDEEKNSAAGTSRAIRLSQPQSPVEIWMIPTDEEAVMAQHVREIVF